MYKFDVFLNFKQQLGSQTRRVLAWYVTALEVPHSEDLATNGENNYYEKQEGKKTD
jgi:hypothetical protein